LEGAGQRRGDPDRVELANRADLLAELHPAAAAEDQVDLLGLAVAVDERRALAGVEAEVGHAGLVGIEGGPGDPRLPALAEAIGRRRVLDLVEVDVGVLARHRNQFYPFRRVRPLSRQGSAAVPGPGDARAALPLRPRPRRPRRLRATNLLRRLPVLFALGR